MRATLASAALAAAVRAEWNPAYDDRHGVVATETSGWNGPVMPMQGGAFPDDVVFFTAADRARRGDYDAVGDVDLADFARFQACFNGPNRAPARPEPER